MGTELSMKIHNTTKFSGRSGENWETWIIRFETRFDDLEDDKLAEVLRDVLDGAALDVCGSLDKKARKDYKGLKSALQKKFGVVLNARRANAELRQLQQSAAENTEAFAERVRKLTNLANPEMTNKQLDQTALEHFLCGLSDLKLQERLHNNDTVLSLEQAVEMCQKLEEKELTLTAMRTTAGHDAMTLTAADQLSTDGAQQNSKDGQTSQILAMVGELRNEIRDIKSQMSGNQNSNQSGRSGRGACFQCGDTAHFKRDCPQLMGRRQQAQQPASSTARSRAISTGVQCLGCGRRGHVVAECWRTPVAAGGIGYPSNPRDKTGAICLNCKRQGHWAANCWQESRSMDPREQTGPQQRTQSENGH